MLLMLGGPSCVGKSYCIERLCAGHGFSVVIPYTTRTPRPLEVPGRDYVFCTTEEISRLSDRFTKGYWAQPVGRHWYGYPDELDQLVFSPTRWVAQTHSSITVAAKAKNPEALSVFIDVSTASCFENRLSERFPDPNEFRRRLAHARHERANSRLFDHVIESDDLNKLEIQLTTIISRYMSGQCNRMDR
jgi:guanylate kinase